MDQVELSIVIPVYGEGALLERSLEEICATLTPLGRPFEIVLVDDGSRDDTWDTIKRLAAWMPFLRALRLSRNFGKESALAAGLAQARGRAVIVMDADLQHPPRLLPEMLRLWDTGDYDVVDAVKARRGAEPTWRRWMAGAFTTLMCRLSGFDLAGASDFKLLSRKVVNAWLRMPETLTFYRGMTEWLGFRHARIEFEVAERAGGRSAWSTWQLAVLATEALVSFSSLPLQAVTLFGLLFLLSAVALGLQTFGRWLVGGALTGFTTVILLQLAIGSLTMICLGIIGLYLGGIYREVKRRPRFVIADSVPSAQEHREQSSVASSAD